MSSIMRGDFRMALSGVRGAKWRSFLTMLGIIVGIVAVVTMVSIGEGIKHQIAGTLNHFGKDLIIIRPGHSGGAPKGLGGSSPDVLFGLGSASALTEQDVDTVSKTSGVSTLTPLGLVAGQPKADDRTSPHTFVLAASSNAAQILNQRIAFGEFWDSDHEDKNVAVIGQNVAQELFKEEIPLGRSFTFRGQEFIVRGVFDPFVNVPFSPTASFDDAIFIPYKVASELTQHAAGYYVILAKTGNPATVQTTIQSVTQRLQNAHGGERDFSVLGAKDSVRTGGEVVRLLTTWISIVAALSLVIGGVGIMNIMLLNVTERMHEIGVRKAIGASSRQVLWQFLFEAAVLSLMGGVIGVLLSLGVIGLLHIYTDLHPVISWNAVGIATGVSLVVGIVFGTAPALKASRKDPIEALRHE
ncbi:MAG TPA: ABC transporter permease [Candidatus Saccharimonadales bacterium]|nr:ABC transporter permease [Candidatus Saccharimonadales bacterium]